MKYPFDYGDEGELSAYEYSAFMDAMSRENRELFKGKGFKNPMYSEAYEEDDYDEYDEFADDEDALDEEWDF